MARRTIGVLFGGACEEHPVSVKSAREVAAHLDPAKWEPRFIGITRDGRWRLCEGPEGDWESGSRPAVLSPDRGARGLLVLDDGKYEEVRLDAVLPVLHGRFGEDGAVQGLLELAGLPYAGCGIAGSALSMDKSLTYLVAAAAGIAVPRFRVVAAGEEVKAAAFAYPVFVKPARSGSSFGVSKAAGPGELAGAIAAAREYDAKVVVEAAVEGREIGCAILGSGADLIAGEVDRIALSHGFFRIHQEERPETGSDNSVAIVPADIPAESRELVRETAKAVYRALDCKGLSRVDMFLTDDGEVVLNEVNTLPGMTSYSRYPRMMAASGLPLGAVLDRLIELALKEDRR